MNRPLAKRITLLVLVIGWASAVAIYFLAEAPRQNPLGYDPLTDKKYVRELQVYGGKANVMSAELMQWFEGLWHGKSLAGTVAVITAIVAWIFWFVATHPELLFEPFHEEPPKPGAKPPVQQQ